MLKFDRNLPENDVKTVKPYFGPQSIFVCTFFKVRLYNNYTKKRKGQKYEIILIFFFETKLYPKSWKINYKIKYLKGSFLGIDFGKSIHFDALPWRP